MVKHNINYLIDAKRAAGSTPRTWTPDATCGDSPGPPLGDRVTALRQTSSKSLTSTWAQSGQPRTLARA